MSPLSLALPGLGPVSQYPHNLGLPSVLPEEGNAVEAAMPHPGIGLGERYRRTTPPKMGAQKPRATGKWGRAAAMIPGFLFVERQTPIVRKDRGARWKFQNLDSWAGQGR